ncbi:FtsW/RodA/SpoVE family cell cycle protein [Fodinicola feengrottensis]|uniref:FtsW/RodA/SpoVE family cell cycle protein n=1 Tax=Fodinicola feengrottensis TaxID=435914 RepID=A0ABN2GVH5_9ACTN
MSTTTASAPTARPAGRRQPTRRNAELLLLLVAMAIVLMVSASIQAALQGTINLNCVYIPAALTAVFLIAHVVVRFFASYADPIILPCVALLNGIGVIFIQRLGLVSATGSGTLPETYGGQGLRQVIWTLVGITAFCVVLLFIRDHRVLSRYSYTLGIGGLLFVILPAVLPSRISDPNNNGAKIWLALPGVGQIQPGEFGKLALMVFFASYLVSKRDVLSLASKRFVGIDLPRGRDLGPVVTAWLVSLLVLMFERDLGTSLLYFGIFITMLYIATERTSWLLIGLVMFIGGSVFAWSVVARVQLRVDIWLHPFADAAGTGYQLVQSLFALGSGGLFGTGPGAGHPAIVPVASSDFITTTLGEEVGLFGLTGILMLYAIISLRGMRTALDVRDSFGKLLAGGMAFSIGLQVFVIIGGVSDLIPLTGVTTPWLSYGGSSLLASWILVAILLRISDTGRRPAVTAAPAVQLQSAPTEVVRL